MKRLSAIAAALVLIGSVAVYALIPGYHRVLTPALFGAPFVAPGIYSDSDTRTPEFQALIRDAMRDSAAFFETPARQPRVILCTTQTCAEAFGLKVRAVALGTRTVLVSPSGINPMILLHEQIHIDLRQYMSLRDLWTPRFPAWFDEGLASHLSNDSRLTGFTVPSAKWITAFETRRDWARVNRGGGWRDSYGAGKALVAAIEAKIGRDGLRDLVRQTARTRNLDSALASRMGANWP